MAVNKTKVLLSICLLALSSVTCAATTERSAEAAAPLLVAVADPSVAPVQIGRVAVDAKPASAGVAEALPDLPMTPAFSVRSVIATLTGPHMHTEPLRDEGSLSLVDTALSAASGVSLLQSSPFAGTARRMGAQHFNTEDGSSIDAFAICYRLSKRSSVQVIPGDPAPVKVPVTTMANNMGVTVGMVFRLSRNR